MPFFILCVSIHLTCPNHLSTSLNLVLDFLHSELSRNIWIPNSVPPGFPIIPLRNFISTACSLLSSHLVHVHVSAPCNGIFLHTHFHFLSVSLFHNKFVLSDNILKRFKFFHLFGFGSCHSSPPNLQSTHIYPLFFISLSFLYTTMFSPQFLESCNSIFSLHFVHFRISIFHISQKMYLDS
jgi:hypothetical protein